MKTEDRGNLSRMYYSQSSKQWKVEDKNGEHVIASFDHELDARRFIQEGN